MREFARLPPETLSFFIGADEHGAAVRGVLQRVAEPEPSQQRQVWITSTDANDESHIHHFLSTAQRFVIDAGQVRMA